MREELCTHLRHEEADTRGWRGGGAGAWSLSQGPAAGDTHPANIPGLQRVSERNSTGRRAPGVPPDVPQMGHAVARCRLGNNAQGAWVESTGRCHTPCQEGHPLTAAPRSTGPRDPYTPPLRRRSQQASRSWARGSLGHLGKGLPSPDLSLLIDKMGTLTSPLRGKRDLNESNNAAVAPSLRGSRTLPQRPQEEGQRPVHRAEPEDHQASSRS